MKPEIERKARLLCDDAREICALMNKSDSTVSMNLLRGKTTLESIIETAGELLKELEQVTPYPR